MPQICLPSDMEQVSTTSCVRNVIRLEDVVEVRKSLSTLLSDATGMRRKANILKKVSGMVRESGQKREDAKFQKRYQARCSGSLGGLAFVLRLHVRRDSFGDDGLKCSTEVSDITRPPSASVPASQVLLCSVVFIRRRLQSYSWSN